MMKKILSNRVTIFAVAISAFLAPFFAHAQAATAAGGAGAALLAPITGAIVIVSYIATWSLGVIIAIVAWFIEILLRLNTQIVASPLVSSGFPVTLSLANLGFVLGIVVIAIMTILRSQTYGIRQALFRLVLMALLVNFGLVIAGTILNFSDSLTLYWLKSSVQSADSATSLDPYQNFASRFTGVFQPQRAVLPANDPAKKISSGSTFWDKINGFFDSVDSIGQVAINATSVFTNLGASAQTVLASIMGLFVILFTVIVLITLVAMLVLRYLYLGILLVLLPLAWASWTFPGINKMAKWWSKFIQQTFFAPFVVFFLWLAMQMSVALETNKLFDITPNSGSLGLAAQKMGIFTSVVGYALQGMMMCAITVAGLVVARNMGVEFAGAGIKAAQSAAKGFGGYVGRRTGGRIAREATGTQPKPSTRTGQLLRAVNPFTWAGKGIGLAANTEYARSRGYTEALKQYGKKTDFGKPKRLWSIAREAENLSKRMTKEQQDLNGLRERAAQTTNPQERSNLQERIRVQEIAINQMNGSVPALYQKAVAEGVNDIKKDDIQSVITKTKEATWEQFATNRGVAGSTLGGALMGWGVWKPKSKLKMSRAQIEALASASGVDLGGGAPAPSVGGGPAPATPKTS